PPGPPRRGDGSRAHRCAQARPTGGGMSSSHDRIRCGPRGYHHLMTVDREGRGRGPRMSRDDRRAQVLSVAQELFSTEGYHHVSMDDIADRAAVSKPVLYRHFPSKLDLYGAVVDERAGELLAAIDAAVEPLEAGPVQPGEGRVVVAA